MTGTSPLTSNSPSTGETRRFPSTTARTGLYPFDFSCPYPRPRLWMEVTLDPGPEAGDRGG